MRELVLLALVAMVSLSNAYAQKCKPKQTITDEMTDVEYELWGGTLASLPAVVMGKGFKAKAFIGKDEKDELFLNFILEYEIMEGNDVDSYNESFTKGDEYLIKMEKGLLKLTIDKYSKGKRKPYKNTLITYDIVSKITEDDIKILTESNITRFRLTTDEGENVENKVKKKRASKLLAQFKCFAKINE